MVDDEEEFLKSASKALERRNITVHTAENARQALKKIQKQSFDVAVIDVKMPGIDGVELFHRMKSQLPDLAVIILTGHGSIAQAFQTSKDGIFDYLEKPCDIDSLANKIRRAVEMRKMNGKTEVEKKSTTEGRRILLVDDEEELLNSLGKVLERRKMQVFKASNGKNALEFLDKHVVDIVILDIKMPGMDGIETLKKIKERDLNVEVILLTGHPDVDNALQGINHGAWEFFIKPVNVEELVFSIKKACEHRNKIIQRKQRQKIDDIISRYPD